MELEGSHQRSLLSWLLAILILGCAPQVDEPTVSPPSSPQPATITSEVEFVSLLDQDSPKEFQGEMSVGELQAVLGQHGLTLDLAPKVTLETVLDFPQQGSFGDSLFEALQAQKLDCDWSDGKLVIVPRATASQLTRYYKIPESLDEDTNLVGEIMRVNGTGYWYTRDGIGGEIEIVDDASQLKVIHTLIAHERIRAYLAQRFGEDLWIHQPEVAVQE